MPDLAQRTRRGSVAGDTQTFAALVADKAGNTLCSADKKFEAAARRSWHNLPLASGPHHNRLIVYRFVALEMKIFPHYRERRDGCMIASVPEVKKEIPLNGRLVCVDSLPARDRGICVVMQSSS